MLASLFATLRPFGFIPAADEERLLRPWTSRQVGEGEVLAQAGAICQELFFIQRGVLRLVARSARGKDVTHSFRSAGDLCTVLASFEQQVPAPVGIQAACPAQVLAIGKGPLDELCQHLPYLAHLLASLTQQALRAKLHTQRAYLGQDATARYHTLLEHQPEVARRVPQHMLASYLGITPQSLSRLRRAEC